MNKYRIRHETLRILCELHLKTYYGPVDINVSNIVEAALTDIPLTELIKKLKITEIEFRRANVALSYNEEIKYNFIENTEKVTLKNAGLIAYEDRKYLKQNFEKRNEKVYSLTKWVLPIVAIIISVFALLRSCVHNDLKTENIYIQLKDTGKTSIPKIDSTKIYY